MWTQQKQRRLKQLEQELKGMEEEYTQAKEVVVNALLACGFGDKGAASAVADKLIDNADLVRDALDPFDSGVRAAAQEG